MAYSWGLLGFSLVKVLAPGYFARQDTKTPVRVGLIALGCNMALNIAVVLPAKHFGFPYPHILLATSTCISAAVNTTLLWRGLARAGVYQARPGWGALLARVLFANAVMAALLIWLGGDLQGWLRCSPLRARGRLALCIVGRRGGVFRRACSSRERVCGTSATWPGHNRRGIHPRSAGARSETSRRRHYGRQLRRHSPRPRRADREHLRNREATRATRDDADVRAAAARVPGAQSAGTGSAGTAHGFSRALARARALGPALRLRAALRREAAAVERRAVRRVAEGAIRRLGGGGRAGLSFRARWCRQHRAAARGGRRGRIRARAGAVGVYRGAARQLERRARGAGRR